MTRICNRVYGSANLLATIPVKDILCCPLCRNPASCHNKPIEKRALFWALNSDTGVSSKAIAKHMTGNSDRNMRPPSDTSDRARCIRLLELVPEWIDRLPEMCRYDGSTRETDIVINSIGLDAYDASWSNQIPLIIKEGNL